jgi:hypothetical protein
MADKAARFAERGFLAAGGVDRVKTASPVWPSTTPASRKSPARRISVVVAHRELPWERLGPEGLRRAAASAAAAQPAIAPIVVMPLASRKTVGARDSAIGLQKSQPQGGYTGHDPTTTQGRPISGG